eukprot:EG_transcript_17914
MAAAPAPPRVLTVCLSPTLQKTLLLPDLAEDEVNRCLTERLDASGKGVNVTRVLRQLGAQATHLTQLGGCFREKFLAMCQEDGLCVEWVESNTEIRFCYTLLSQAKRTSTEVVEEAPAVAPAVEAAVRRAFAALLPAVQAVAVSGSKARGFSAALFPDMVRLAKAEGKLVVLDYRKDDLLHSLPHGPDVVKPNFAEFLDTFFPGQTFDSDEAAVRAVKDRMLALRREYGCTVIVTRGSCPTLYTTDQDTVGELLPEVLEPVNTIGCGDAMTAGVLFALATGQTTEEAVALGHRCAKQNAQHLRPGVIQP